MKTPQGRRYHGRIVASPKGEVFFERRIDGRAVRWSDHAFCLNTSAIPKLKLKGVSKIVFFYRKADTTEGHRITLADALKIESTTNEHGESNIRIPLDECEIVKVWKNEKFDLISKK